jgi:hypothetical protein
MADKKEHPMVSWIAKYDDALADKPFLAPVYDTIWRQKIHTRLLTPGNVCYVGNAFGYQAPLLEACGLIRQGWQCKLEQGAEFLLPKLSDGERRHLTRRMQDRESTSAEEELLLARGFALEFGRDAVAVPQTPSDKPRPEFEVEADGHRVLVEAKGRTRAESVEREREFRRRVESLLGIQIQAPPPLDDKVDQWTKNTIFRTLRSKSERDSGFILVLSLYTLTEDGGVTAISAISELAENPGNPTCSRKSPGDLNLSPEHWPLAIALVSGGSIWGVWFNSTVCERLGIGTGTQERIRAAIRNSFYSREDGVFLQEGMRPNS